MIRHLSRLWHGHYGIGWALFCLILVGPLALGIVVPLLILLPSAIAGEYVNMRPVLGAAGVLFLGYQFVAVVGVWMSASRRHAEMRTAGVMYPILPALGKLVVIGYGVLLLLNGPHAALALAAFLTS